MTTRERTRGGESGPAHDAWRWSSWLAAAALVAFVATRIDGYAQHVDLHYADEVLYMTQGSGVLSEGLPGLAYAPAYSLVAGLFWLLTPGGFIVSDVLHAAMILLGAFGTWWAFRPVLPRPLPLLGACWFASLPPMLQTGSIGGIALPNVHAAGMAGMALLVGCLARGWTWWASLAALFTFGTRPETGLWFVLIAALALWRRASFSRRDLTAMVVVAGLAMAASALLPSMRERAWLAFQQHYARYAVTQRLLAEHARSQRQPTPEDYAQALQTIEDAFHSPAAIIAADFPGASSLASALRTSPSRCLGFAGANVESLPAALRHALLPAGVSPRASIWVWAGLAVVAGFGWWRQLRRNAASAPPAVVAGITALAAPACLVATLWVGPRPELSLPLFWTVWCVVGRGAAALLPSTAASKRWLEAASAVVVTGISVLVPGPFRAPAANEPRLRACVQLLREHAPPPGSRVLCAMAWCIEAHTARCALDCVELSDVMPSATGSDLEAALEARGIRHVVLGDDLRRQFAAFRVTAELSPSRWLVVAERGTTQLLRRSTTPR